MGIPAILQQLQGGGIGGGIGQLKQMMNTIRMASNPQAALSQAIQNNPQMQQVMSTVQQYGGDPQKAFYALCQQRGVNPNEILDMLK